MLKMFIAAVVTIIVGLSASVATAQTWRSEAAPLQSRLALASVTSSIGSKAYSKPAVQFACVQPPNACSSGSDCSCSGCCAQLGDGGPSVCQPSCRK